MDRYVSNWAWFLLLITDAWDDNNNRAYSDGWK